MSSCIVFCKLYNLRYTQHNECIIIWNDWNCQIDIIFRSQLRNRFNTEGREIFYTYFLPVAIYPRSNKASMEVPVIYFFKIALLVPPSNLCKMNSFSKFGNENSSESSKFFTMNWLDYYELIRWIDELIKMKINW
jgi:hypothetical protein